MRESQLRHLVDTRTHHPEAIAAAGFTGGKMLVRIDPEDRATAATLQACAAAVNELAAQRLIAMIEPFISRRVDGKVRNDLTPEAWRKTLQLPTVRGFVIGRSLLFPPDDNVAAAVDAVVEML